MVCRVQYLHLKPSITSSSFTWRLGYLRRNPEFPGAKREPSHNCGARPMLLREGARSQCSCINRNDADRLTDLIIMSMAS